MVFFAATFVLTWAAWLPRVFTGEQEFLRIAGTFAPALTALALTGVLDGGLPSSVCSHRSVD